VPQDRLKLLASLFHFENFKEGEHVITEGNIGDKFYIIMNGSARVTKSIICENGTKEEKYLDTRKTGEWFGDIALIKKTLRTASVTACGAQLTKRNDVGLSDSGENEKSLTCLVLKESQFDEFLFQLPPGIQNCIQTYAKERCVSILKFVPFFSTFVQNKLELLTSLFHFQVRKAEEIVIREGEKSMFVIVLRGIVNLREKTQVGEMFIRNAGTYEQNDFFGEESLLKVGTVTSNFNVICVTTCSLLILDPQAFRRYLEYYPGSEDEIRIALTRHRRRKSLTWGKHHIDRDFNRHECDGVVVSVNLASIESSTESTA